MRSQVIVHPRIKKCLFELKTNIKYQLEVCFCPAGADFSSLPSKSKQMLISLTQVFIPWDVSVCPVMSQTWLEISGVLWTQCFKDLECEKGPSPACSHMIITWSESSQSPFFLHFKSSSSVPSSPVWEIIDFFSQLNQLLTFGICTLNYIVYFSKTSPIFIKHSRALWFQSTGFNNELDCML